MSLSALVVPLMVVAAPSVPASPTSESLARPVTVAQGPAAAPAPASTPAPTPSSPTSTAAVEATGPNEIVVTRRAPSPADPVEHLNAISYGAVQAVDNAVVAPIAHTYKAGVPKPARDGLHNVLNNLDEPIVFLNFLLQLKPGKALETLGRFAINSTLGVGGLFDIAKREPFNLPRRSNGLADTLGYYGVGPGPYLFLPVIGATTLRDVLARPFDLLVLPAVAPKPFADPKVSLAKGVLSALDEREQDDEKLARLHAAPDPYVAQREEYLARRRAEIEVLKGQRKSIYDPPYYQLPPLPEPENGDTIAPQAPAAAPPASAPATSAPGGASS